MASEKSKEKSEHPGKSDQPKYRQLVRMLSFRIVPAYYKKIDEENYAFYYTNSGGGIGYQNPVSGDANTGMQ